MVSELVRTLRRLTRPLRRSFWMRKPSRRHDAPGVLLLAFSHAEGNECERLLQRPHQYQAQGLTESVRPLEPEDHPDSLLAALYRMMITTRRTLTFLPQLVSGELPWSVHLLESESLARVHQEILEGKPVVLMGDLRSRRHQDVRQLEGLVRHLEHRRYECWFVFRDRQTAYVPAGLAFPGEPLSISELQELALARTRPRRHSTPMQPLEPPQGVLRIMSYNVHSCIGLDGRLSVRRIAEVLERYSPHFVALQELDSGCPRTEGVDQLQELARLWPSTPYYCPTFERPSGGSYGIGCLSRIPVKHWRQRLLSEGGTSVGDEPRAAMAFDLEWPEGGSVTLINTHLGLTRAQRERQLAALEEYIDHGQADLILVGDLNCRPYCPEHKRLLERLSESQQRHRKTWFGTYPVRVLDYALYRGSLQVERITVPRDNLTETASDHLPLVVDFRKS